MEPKVEAYIHKLVSQLHCGKEEKKDIIDEVEDHLNLLIQEYKEAGFTNEAAVNKALESFGEQDHIATGLQTSLSPLYKVLKIMTSVLFGLYAFIILFKLLLERIINLAFTSKQGVFLNHYVAVPKNYKGIFDFAYIHLNANFIPFKTTLHYMLESDSYNLSVILHNTIGNVLLFLPLGLFLPLLFKKYRVFSKMLVFVAIASLSIELLQLIVQVGQFDIDDIILNTIGSSIGFWCFVFLQRIKNEISSIPSTTENL
ncbi:MULTISPECIES: VanZ family protein [Clostridia]|uniref:VanZ family protein n=1 Tax=Clostridia TaxID=186801 RepID=UPI00131454C5|nr:MULTISPECIES: VanZ family protein [Clostridia]